MMTTVIESKSVPTEQRLLTLNDWIKNAPDGTEWVDGQLLEKNGMTAKHSRSQARLSFYWINYKISSRQQGEVYTEPSCRTMGRGRKPDVAYLTPELIVQYGEDFDVLPQSFPLIAEVILPTDLAEDVIAKSQEYLQSGCQEVWLLFPENKWIIIVTENQRSIFVAGETISTQKVLLGFSATVDELLG